MISVGSRRKTVRCRLQTFVPVRLLRGLLPAALLEVPHNNVAYNDRLP